MPVGVSARVRADCWAYAYNGDRNVKLTFGAKVYMVVRCADKNRDVLAYIKKGNLYR